MTDKYSDFLEINPLFESCVDLDSDKRNKNLWEEYIVGDDMESLMDLLCKSLGREAPNSCRSFWINGSYGTGKTYAAIFVKHLLEESPEKVGSFLAKNSRLSKFKPRFNKCRGNGDYLVVWDSGCTDINSGTTMLAEAERAIRDALIQKYGDNAFLGANSLIDEIRYKLNDPDLNWESILKNTQLSEDYVSVDALREYVDNGDFSTEVL